MRIGTLAVWVALLAVTGTAATGGDVSGAATGGPITAGSQNPFRGDGMWIWYVSRSSGGNPAGIARKANRHGIETVYIKSSDGSNGWSQFSSSLVSQLHSRGLRVCAWQFVYGSRPRGEARRGAEAVAKGADCLVIDAESHYEGRYAAADRYIDKLRNLIGKRFPLSLTSFPFVDYHPAFPYSVFLGPGGARYNQPQLYWHTIGVTVREGFRHTFRFNRVFKRPILPLGQTYDNPPLREINRFRRFAISYGFNGVSWWSWQETGPREWDLLAKDIDSGVRGFERPNVYPRVARGDRGDVVIWAQEHLNGAGQSVRVSGIFGDATGRAVRRFQRAEGLLVDGVIGRATWRRLLDHRPISVDWSAKATRSGKRGGAQPQSASLPALRDEIPPPAGR
jgi:hypothetical protein